MGMFADSVGELPGRAEDVRAVAQNLATLKTDLGCGRSSISFISRSHSSAQAPACAM